MGLFPERPNANLIDPLRRVSSKPPFSQEAVPGLGVAEKHRKITKKIKTEWDRLRKEERSDTIW